MRKHLDKILNSTENKLFDFIPLNNLSNIINYQKISSEFLEELMSMPEAAKYPYLWTSISRAQKLSSDFITNYKFQLNWASLCKYQNLTPELMEDNLSLLSFGFLSRFQKLSPEFINKHFDKLVISQLVRNKKLSLESKRALLNHSEKIVLNLFNIKD